MCSNPAPLGRHWDGAPRRPLRTATTSPSRLLRTGHSSCCHRCGNRIDVYRRADLRFVALHPRELAVTHTPAPCRWHLSCGIAHPHEDGSAWCRIPHAVLCPRRIALTRLSPYLEELRRQLAVRSRRLVDTGAFVPPHPPGAVCTPSAHRRHPARRPALPVVQLLLGRYLADRPLEQIGCVAQTRRRRRCAQRVLTPHAPAGRWRLLPADPHHTQRAPLAALMAVYDLSRLTHAEQLRWRSQRCPLHAAAPGAPDLALTGWQVFDPLLHVQHIRARLPHDQAGPEEA
ncbi:DUF6083 domain-containing protein [Streptomyces sp. SLBN-8D4]|uniref:DUF6083 domain-containing protein n=1 Tax=Streptomyces sp. SLBN-8D4 TaxID=3377728 RepID=UPI003C7D199A